VRPKLATRSDGTVIRAHPPPASSARASSAHRASVGPGSAAASAVVRAGRSPAARGSVLTEIYLCHACSCHEIIDGNTPGQVARVKAEAAARGHGGGGGGGAGAGAGAGAGEGAAPPTVAQFDLAKIHHHIRDLNYLAGDGSAHTARRADGAHVLVEQEPLPLR
jgi:hypothetical protein